MTGKMRQDNTVAVQLLLFHQSPDASLPECICSLCRKTFVQPDFLKMGIEPDDQEFLDAMNEDDQSVPVRMWPKAKGPQDKQYEIRFHPACLEQVAGPGDNPRKLQFRPGLQISWAWGDDQSGRLLSPQATIPVSP